MNNIFNPKRFWNYLCWDVNNAAGKFGISAIILGGLPLVFFVFKQFFHKIFEGCWARGDQYTVFVCLFIVCATTILSFPVKAYGPLTEKKFGSSWALIPASVFEKWLSMMLVLCVVVPVAIGVPFLVCDSLMSWIFPAHYGHSILGGIDADTLAELKGLNLGFIVYASLATCIMTFTLGAVIFKKGKTAWTFVSIFLISSLLGIVFMKIIGQVSFTTEELMLRWGISDEEGFIRIMNRLIVAWYVLVAVVLGGGLFARLKTIKY